MGSISFLILLLVLFFIFNLRGRVIKLEGLINSNASLQKKEASSELIKSETERPLDSEVTKHVVAPKSTGPTPLDNFTEWLKHEWMLKLGALLLLIGFGWLTTYAFLNNWIGPMGRIALGIIAGALFIAFGWQRTKKYIYQGGVFLVLGSTVVLLTIFAAREIYNFFTPLTALSVMFLSTAFVALASVKHSNRALGLASLILAGVAPLLTNAPTPNYVSLFSYLFVVILGAIWITVLTNRRELTTVALIIIILYSLPHLFHFVSADRGVLLLFAYAFAVVFFITNTAGILKLRDKNIVPDLVTASGNGLLLLAWIMTAAQDEWKSLIIAAWMVVFAVGAFLIFRVTQRREPFYVYAGVGIAMLAAATSAELRGATLTIAYTIESGIITLITYMILRDINITKKISWLLIFPVLLSFSSLTSYSWRETVFNKHFFVLFVLALTFFGLGAFFLKTTKEIENKKSQWLNALIILGSLYAYALLWLALQAGLKNDNTAVMISLLVYTIVGLVSYFYGLKNNKRGIQLYGGVLIGFIVLRLLFVDVWKMEIAGKIVTFFMIGALLMSTAFLGRKKEDKIIPNNSI